MVDWKENMMESIQRTDGAGIETMRDLEQEIRQEFGDQDEQSTKVGVLRTCYD